ncbi:MAG: hypothetical protein R2715_04420 [Ilumatobacteraceae bacterium]
MMQGLNVGSGAVAGANLRSVLRRRFDRRDYPAHGEVVKILAPLTTAPTLLHEGLDVLAEAVRQVASSSLVRS